MPVLLGEPPVLVDWLPSNHNLQRKPQLWSRTFNGDTLHLDDGIPTAVPMSGTPRKLRKTAPRVFCNVLTGFEAIANAIKADDALQRNLLSSV